MPDLGLNLSPEWLLAQELAAITPNPRWMIGVDVGVQYPSYVVAIDIETGETAAKHTMFQATVAEVINEAVGYVQHYDAEAVCMDRSDMALAVWQGIQDMRDLFRRISSFDMLQCDSNYVVQFFEDLTFEQLTRARAGAPNTVRIRQTHPPV